MDITTTRHGLRLSQHGVVISEMRTSAGPTHSVFDVLAALILVLAPSGRVGVLGFAGGGMMAPLAALGVDRGIDSVDLDQESHALFCRHCPAWAGRVAWEHADAEAWLRRQPSDFSLLMDDLSVPCDGDVTKPAISWEVLPGAMRSRLRTGGITVANLLPPSGGPWEPALSKMARGSGTARIIHLDDFVNRILVAGDDLPSARWIGSGLRVGLRRIGSRQAGRIHVRALR